MRADMITLRDVLREFLIRQKGQARTTQRLSEVCGVSRPALSQTLAGKEGHEVTVDVLASFCANTGTPPHRLLMSLLIIANEMETNPNQAGGTVMPQIDYVSLGRKSAVDADLAAKMKGGKKVKQRRKKQP